MGQRRCGGVSASSRRCSSRESLCCAAVSWSLTSARSLRRAAALERSFDGGVGFGCGEHCGCAAPRARGGVALGDGLGMRDATDMTGFGIYEGCRPAV